MRIPHEEPAPIGQEVIELEPDVVGTILAALLLGWQHACQSSDVNADAGEVPMTERLRDGLRIEIGKCAWGKPIIVLPGTESRSTPSVLVPDGRTDIPLMHTEIFLRGGGHDPHAIIECKRIAGSDTHLCREYVVEGVDRFITGKYGANHGIGFMVGYVLSGTGDQSADGVNAYLGRVTRTDDMLAKSSTAGAWESKHERTAPMSEVRLHHAFLEMGATA